MSKARSMPAASGALLARAQQAAARGDTRRARALAREALAADPGRDGGAAHEILMKTRVDPVALGVAGAVLVVISLATWLSLLHS